MVAYRAAMLSGIERSIWKLVNTDTTSNYQNALGNVGTGELSPTGVNAMFSVGLFLDHHGDIEDVLWHGPSFKAGLAPGMKILSINGHTYSTRVLRHEIAQAHADKKPLHIRAQGDGVTRQYTVHYESGLKYPHLVRLPGTTDYLDRILQ